MKDEVLEICRDICCEDITVDQELVASGILNSYRIMEIICELEEKFHITFGVEDIGELDNFSNVNQITKVLGKYILDVGKN